jgi:predicted TPR repeat methyltransferase
MLPHDIGLFLKSAYTDASIQRARRTAGPRAAFEAIYAKFDDPWASASPSYRYQRLKYDKLIGLLPKRPFARALDLGCGVGVLSQKLARCADHVLGIDLATAAVEHARRRGAAFDNLRFEQGDILNLSPALNGQFDLVVIADVAYYLAPNERLLTELASRIADLLRPDGICLLANHFFFSVDPGSKISRTIHRAFSRSPRLSVMTEHRRAFFLATFLSREMT